MPNFTLDENVLMLEILELGPSYLSYLKGQQQNAFIILGSAFLDRVRLILDEYVTLDENEAASSATAKTGLKKADVLEWFGPSESKNQVSADRLYRIKSKLSTILNISSNIGSSNDRAYHGTPIKKS